MSDRNAPIDEKWLDRPRAKRSSDEPSIGGTGAKKHRTISREASRESENNIRQTERSIDQGTNEQQSKNPKEVHQTNLFNFFSSSSNAKATKIQKISHQQVTEPKIISQKPSMGLESSSQIPKSSIQPQTSGRTSEQKEDKHAAICDSIPKPMIPSIVPQPRNVTWSSPMENVIIRKVNGEAPRTKIAAMDLDGTLAVWRTSGWPSRLEHYELWSSTVLGKLRSLHDDGHKLVIFTNQGAIRKAHDGKKAALVKNVINWIARLVDRPIHAVMSTTSPKIVPNSYHKPSEKMWGVAIRFLNNREPFNITKSFFVGDSADLNDEQGGVDLRFATAVGMKYGDGSELQFYEPSQLFGTSDSVRRASAKSVEHAITPPPNEALAARAALLGGYYAKTPIMLLLCGVQGSGKSFFCERLLCASTDNWVHLSQDTINNGKPGKREQVQAQAREAIKNGKCVVVDRMHLDPSQRKYFIDLAKSLDASVHVAVLQPPKNVIFERVRCRKNHPSNVIGESGVRQASLALQKMTRPSYDEEIELITCVATAQKVDWLASLYGNIMEAASRRYQYFRHHDIAALGNFKLPTISLGTMGIGKRKATDTVFSMINAGFDCVDTSASYKNLEDIGKAISSSENDVVCIAKIPKAVSTPEEVRLSLDSILQKLKRKKADLLLLHWPCDVMTAGLLSVVWEEMERCSKKGLCEALGVCNFNVGALASLLSMCTIRPVVNQVERHPLLAQWDLIDFCLQNDILIQAHSPLGQGRDELLKNPLLQRIARETSMSTAQVVIQWDLQHGVLVTPKCATLEHANEILHTRPLSSDQMKAIDSLDIGRRFVNPPFMYGKSVFCWGNRNSQSFESEGK